MHFTTDQDKILIGLEQFSRTYIQLGRREGLTTILNAFILAQHYIKPATTTVIVNRTTQESRHAATEFRDMLEKAKLGFKLTNINQVGMRLILSDRFVSLVKFVNASSAIDSLRGGSVDRLIFDGFEQIQNQTPENLIQILEPILHERHGKIIYGCNSCNEDEMRYYGFINARLAYLDKAVNELKNM